MIKIRKRAVSKKKKKSRMKVVGRRKKGGDDGIDVAEKEEGSGEGRQGFDGK